MIMLYDLIKRQDTLKYFFNKIQLLRFSHLNRSPPAQLGFSEALKNHINS